MIDSSLLGCMAAPGGSLPPPPPLGQRTISLRGQIRLIPPRYPEDCMIHRLSTLLRTVVCLIAASSLLAVTTAILSAPASFTYRYWRPRWDVMNAQRWPHQPHELEHDRLFLIDRESGRSDVLPLPGSHRWGELSVTPWYDEEGQAEAVGHCYSLSGLGGKTSFWGLARVQLSTAKIIDMVQLDLLPTGRPCWVPNQPGKFLFAAGDGGLYRFAFPDTEQFGEATGDDATSTMPRSPQPVTWKCPRPTSGFFFIADPVWPSHPQLDEHPLRHGDHTQSR